MENERLTIWLNLVKFLLGTVALGLVTTCVNKEIQDREIEIKELNQLGQFVEHALTEDIGVRYRFAQYFSLVIRSDQLRERWAAYYKIVEADYNETKTKRDELEESLSEGTLTDEEKQAAQQKVAQLNDALSPRPFQRSESVRQAQLMLRDLGFSVAWIDGILGPSTRAAIEEFQRTHGLEPDGVLGPQTYTKIASQWELFKAKPN